LPFSEPALNLHARIMIVAANPHPAVRATVSRKRETVIVAAFIDRGDRAKPEESYGAPPLPLAGKGWGEGRPPPIWTGGISLAPRSGRRARP